MSKSIKISKGLDIKLKGEAEKVLANANHSDTYVLRPTDFHLTTPKLLLKEGAKVKAGTPIFFDKYRDQIQFVSPVSGEIVEIKRGEKRRILEVKILADKEISYESFPKLNPNDLNGEEVKKALLSSGCWPFIKQRPVDIIANPDVAPKAIYISAFDSSPLAPDYDFIVHNHAGEFQAGIDAISKLTEGKVHLNIRGDVRQSSSFTNAKNVQINKVSGPHPAGNVGVQIHHIDPINSGEFVWYVNPQDVLTIGRLFLNGTFDASKIVAFTGPKAKSPKYFKTISGASIKSIVDGAVNSDNVRYIAGNVLTGENVGEDGHLSFYAHQVTVVEEGNHHKFFLGDGWLGAGLNKHSMSRTYFSWLMGNKKYDLDTNQNGEDRSFVLTGQYEKVFPFDIYPVYLVKAIITKDIEAMEQLGIYEVAPEDFALCEYVCTSKINVQDIVREGLDIVHEECM